MKSPPSDPAPRTNPFTHLSGVAALAALFASLAPAPAADTNFAFKAEASVQETYDSNVYLQDVTPHFNPALVHPGAVLAQPLFGSFVNTVTPRLAFDYQPDAAFHAAVSYAPEVVIYDRGSSEDHVTHRGAVNLGGTTGALTWEHTDNFTWIDGNDYGLDFGGPGAPVCNAPAIGGLPTRDRRSAFIYRGGLKLTYTWDKWFLRPVASGYIHDFFTHQIPNAPTPGYAIYDPYYENYVDRKDVNGGLDLGYQVLDHTWLVAGYRYGSQFTGNLPGATLNGVPLHYDSVYHRLLLGVEGQPTDWAKLTAALGPEFHHFTDVTALKFNRNPVAMYIDAGGTLQLSKQDTLALLVKRYLQPSYASASVYNDVTYNANWRRRLNDHFNCGAGFQAYEGDWAAPVIRDDWIYTANASLGYVHDKHWGGELGYSYDFALSQFPGFAGRGFTRHMVWLGIKYTL